MLDVDRPLPANPSHVTPKKFKQRRRHLRFNNFMGVPNNNATGIGTPKTSASHVRVVFQQL